MPDGIRPLLKRPLGELFFNTEAAVKRLKQMGSPKLISVGDFVTAELLCAGIKPDVAVIDFKVMRERAGEEITKRIEALGANVRKVKNPAGTITRELREVFGARKFPLKVIVDGEEDLATIPAVLSAPLRSVVVYGQPSEGLVLIEVTDRKRREFERLLKLFEPVG